MKPSRGPNPERIGRPEPNCCPETHYEAPEAPQREGSGPRRARTRGPGGCAASRRPSACAASVRRKPLEDVGVAAQIHPAHAPGLVEMGIGALQPFAALPQQASPAGTPNAPPVAIHRGARRPFTLPTASPAVRLRHVAAKPQGRPTQPTSRCCDTPCPRPPLRYHHPPARPPQPARPRSPASRPSSSYRRHSQPTRTAMTSRKIVRSNALFAGFVRRAKIDRAARRQYGASRLRPSGWDEPRRVAPDDRKWLRAFSSTACRAVVPEPVVCSKDGPQRNALLWSVPNCLQ